METIRVMSVVLITFTCKLVHHSDALGGRRVIEQLRDFKDEMRNELRYIHIDIAELSEAVKNISIVAKQRDSKVLDVIGDGEASEVGLGGKAVSKDNEETIKDLLQKYERLQRALHTEKRLNRALKQQLNSFKETVIGRLDDTTIKMTSITSYVNQEVDDKIQNVIQHVQMVDETIQKVVEDVQNVSEHAEEIDENVHKMSKQVQHMGQTLQKVSETGEKVRENVSKVNIDVHEEDANEYSSTTVKSPSDKPRHGDETTTSSHRDTCQTVPDSGVYGIYFESMNANVRVYCDQDTDGGGWIVVMRRKDGSVDFTRSWQDYKDGFGNLNGEFWSGNDLLYKLTESKPTQLRIDMEDFDGNKKFAQYEKFQIGHEEDKYRLTVSDYSGTAGDSLTEAKLQGGVHDGQKFSTFDSDNDSWKDHCADRYKGGWWFNKCFYSHLTGMYRPTGKVSDYRGIMWHSWTEYTNSLKFVEMKIRLKIE